LYTQESSRGRGVRVLCLANTKSWDTSVKAIGAVKAIGDSRKSIQS